MVPFPAVVSFYFRDFSCHLNIMDMFESTKELTRLKLATLLSDILRDFLLKSLRETFKPGLSSVINSNSFCMVTSS